MAQNSVTAKSLGILLPEGFPELPEGWTTELERFPSADRTIQLFGMYHHPEVRNWEAHPHAHRALIVIHGLGEHGGRYFHLPYFLKETFGSIYCMDQRGHGRSEGLRGYCDSFEQFTNDVAECVSRLSEKLKQRFGKAEIHVLGHSFGGLVVLRTHFLNATLPVKSVIASSPLLGITAEVPLVKKMIGRGLSRIWGSLQINSEIHPEDVSHDPAVVYAYSHDKLVTTKVTPRLYTEMVDSMKDTLARDAGFPYPLMMITPLQDRIVDADAEQSFFKNLKVRDKEIQLYPTFYHESMNELGKEKVFEDISKWTHKISQNHSPN